MSTCALATDYGETRPGGSTGSARADEPCPVALGSHGVTPMAVEYDEIAALAARILDEEADDLSLPDWED